MSNAIAKFCQVDGTLTELKGLPEYTSSVDDAPSVLYERVSDACSAVFQKLPIDGVSQFIKKLVSLQVEVIQDVYQKTLNMEKIYQPTLGDQILSKGKFVYVYTPEIILSKLSQLRTLADEHSWDFSAYTPKMMIGSLEKVRALIEENPSVFCSLCFIGLIYITCPKLKAISILHPDLRFKTKLKFIGIKGVALALYILAVREIGLLALNHHHLVTFPLIARFR